MLNEAKSQSSISVSGQSAFLRRLTLDDEFRARLLANPRATLGEYGVRVEAHQLPEHVVLPEKEEFLEVLDDLDAVAPLQKELRWFGLFGE